MPWTDQITEIAPYLSMLNSELPSNISTMISIVVCSFRDSVFFVSKNVQGYSGRGARCTAQGVGIPQGPEGGGGGAKSLFVQPRIFSVRYMIKR